MKTPDQQVSEQIVAAFEKKQLLRGDSLKGLADKLASGKMTSNEWKVLFKLEAAQTRKSDGSDQA